MIIYKTSLVLWKDMFRFRVEKYECRETIKSYIFPDKTRINKEKIDVIIDDITINDIKSLRYVCWITDKTKIPEVKIQLKERISKEINNFKEQIRAMENMFYTEPINSIKDYTKDDDFNPGNF